MRTIHRLKPNVQLQKKLHHMAHDLRQRATPAETILWQYLKGKNRFNVRFRRQYPIHSYIADFCCYQHKLIIEIDGSIHDTQVERDQNKDWVLKQYGFKIIRFKNHEVVNNLDSVLHTIQNSLFSSIGEEG